MSTNQSDPDETSEGRRELLKAIAAASGVIATRILLPIAWTAPIVTSMPLPAHAAMSSCGPITGSVANGVVTLTLKPSASAIAGRKQIQVLEKQNILFATAPGQEQVVALLTPSSATDFSGSFTLELKRPDKGSYEYRMVCGDETELKLVVQVQ